MKTIIREMVETIKQLFAFVNYFFIYFIQNLPNFFSNFTKKLKLNFPHFHFAYQFDIIPYIHKKSNRHARILRLWQSLFSYTSILFSPICFYDCFSFSGGIRMIVPSGTRRS